MANHTQTASRDIAAEPDRVWRALTHLADREATFSTLSGVEAPEGPVRIGTTWRETATVDGQAASQRVEVTELEALGLMTLVARGDGDEAGRTTTYKLQALHPGTRVTLTMSAAPAPAEEGGAAGFFRKAVSAVTSALSSDDEGADTEAERELADLAAAVEGNSRA